MISAIIYQCAAQITICCLVSFRVPLCRKKELCVLWILFLSLRGGCEASPLTASTALEDVAGLLWIHFLIL